MSSNVWQIRAVFMSCAIIVGLTAEAEAGTLKKLPKLPYNSVPNHALGLNGPGGYGRTICPPKPVCRPPVKVLREVGTSYNGTCAPKPKYCPPITKICAKPIVRKPAVAEWAAQYKPNRCKPVKPTYCAPKVPAYCPPKKPAYCAPKPSYCPPKPSYCPPRKPSYCVPKYVSKCPPVKKTTYGNTELCKPKKPVYCPPKNEIPEPSSMLLAAMGAAGAFARMRRRRGEQAAEAEAKA